MKALKAINWYDTCISNRISSSSRTKQEEFKRNWILDPWHRLTVSGIILAPHSACCSEVADSSTSRYWIQIFTSWFCSNVRRTSIQRDSHWSWQTVCDQLVTFRQTDRQLFSTMFSCLSSGSPRLLLPGCVKNSITAPGPQLGRVAVIKLHHSASREGCVSPFSSLFLSYIHFLCFFILALSVSSSITFFKGVVKHFGIWLQLSLKLPTSTSKSHKSTTFYTNKQDITC